MILPTSRVATVSVFLLSATSTLALPLNVTGRGELNSRGYFDDYEPELFRRAGSCFRIDERGAQRIPGFGKLEDARNKFSGPNGGLHINPSEYPDRSAMACLRMTEITSRWDAPPVCSEEIMDVTGRASGVDVSINGGKEATRESRATWTVMKSSEFSSGAELSFTMGTEATGQVGAKMSTSMTIKDESSTSTETVETSKEFINYTFENKAGQECRATLKVTTCTGKARAEVPVTVQGYYWWWYHDRVGSPPAFHWSYKSEDYLSEDERTRNIELSGSVKTVTRGDYKVECKTGNRGRTTAQKVLANAGARMPAAAGKKSEGSSAKGKSGKGGKGPQAPNPKAPSGKQPGSKPSGNPAQSKGAAPKKAAPSNVKKPAPKKA